MTTRVVAFNVLCSGIGRSCQLTMFNAFLMVMLVLSSVSQAQQLPDSAAVIQGAPSSDKRSLLNGVTTSSGGPSRKDPMSSLDYGPSSDMMDNAEGLDNLLVDEENYWREVKAIIGGVLGFWGGVGGLGTMFLVLVLSQRYCCKKDDDKDDGDG